MMSHQLPCVLTASFLVIATAVGQPPQAVAESEKGATSTGHVLFLPVISAAGVSEAAQENSTTADEPDCNENGIPDQQDIWNGTSDDCNWNFVPDECEPDDDCNENGIQDICDLYDRTSSDCNESGVLDECEMESGRFFWFLADVLVGSYGSGYLGGGPDFYSGDYAFDQQFAVVRAAWLRIRFSFLWPQQCDGYLDGQEGLYDCARLTDGEWCVPLPVSAESLDGHGTVGLHILPPCCDLPAVLSEATLWFDAIPLPAPTTLSDYAPFYACFRGADVIPLEQCDPFDYDRDSDVDLADIGIFARAFTGP